ncbi:MAG TPA: Hsp20/alpha crystallin family protein [Candidatus Limnocylindria bacterium]|nr:Hsp20/alpha crystallin family protein [Candidatus Limnocylindria bacterium]
MTTTLARISPMADFISLRDAMDQLFQDSFIRPTAWTGLAAAQLAVPVDLWETPDAFHLRADIPGLTADDIDLNVTADTVQIAGEIKGSTDVSQDGWLRQERRTGKFARAFQLSGPIDTNKVEASFENGVLTMVLPKAESVRPKQIKIGAQKHQ